METNFIPERMRQARRERKLSQKELATKTFFAPSTISSFENGLINPSERALRLIAQTLGKKVEYFTDLNISESESDQEGGPESAISTTEIEVETTVVDEITTLLDICRVLVQRGKYEEALNNLVQLDETSLTDVQCAQANFLKAQALIRTGKSREARRLLSNLNQPPELSAPAPTLAQIRFELGVSYFAEQQLKDAIEQFNRALEALGERADEDSMGFRIYSELGRVWRQEGDTQKAAEYYEKAHQHRHATKDDRVLANLLLSEGMALVQQGKLVEARSKLLESERLFDKLKFIEQARTVGSYLDVVRAELGQLDENAQNSTETAPDKEKDLPENSSATSEAIVMTNQAAVLHLKGKHDPAILEEAVKQMERTLQFIQLKQTEIRPMTISDAYFEAAKLWVMLGRQEQAIEAFDCAIQALRESSARWYKYDKIYDEYQSALADWNRAEEVMKIFQQRRDEQKRINSQEMNKYED